MLTQLTNCTDQVQPKYDGSGDLERRSGCQEYGETCGTFGAGSGRTRVAVPPEPSLLGVSGNSAGANAGVIMTTITLEIAAMPAAVEV